jgi:hypothetical protein
LKTKVQGDVTQGMTSAAAKAKGATLAAILGTGLVLALLIGGVGFLFYGLDSLLTRWLDPAVAALLVGGGALALLLGGGLVAVRKFWREA